ncbi:MAG: hypothetical protein ACJ74W_01245 [Pyrinomonadaceae bacterium]
MRLDSTGSVGIGTTAPTTALHVEGASTDTNNYVQGYFKNTNAALPYGGIAVDGQNQSHVRFMLGGALKWQWRVGAGTGTDDLRAYSVALGSDVLTLKNNGSVGIGTTAPLHSLDVAGNMTIGPGYTSVTTVPANGLIVQGNVGIGMPNPDAAYALDVNGSVRISGNINSRYQDVAEWVESSQQLAAGTVVVLDPGKSNQVLASTVAYDTSVAGVVSARPGIALGEAGTNKVLVATTGRVKVHVDATRAPIHIGDLLVTSDVSGVAMKSEPITIGGRQMHAPGTLIGKALEPLDKGVGEILVLLSLQ